MARTLARKSDRAKSHADAINRPSITEDEFGHYSIKAGRLNGNFIARAFPKANSRSRGLIAEAGGASEEEAIGALKDVLKQRDVERTATRRWEDRSEITVPTREEFSEALHQTNLSGAQCAMLKAHAIAGADGLTIVSLMNAGGYRSRETARKVFDRAGALLADFLQVEFLEVTAGKTSDALRIIGFRKASGEEKDDELSLWVMHEELRQAVRTALY